MDSVTLDAAPDDDDLDARCARIRQMLLDGIEATLYELAQSTAQEAAIADALWARGAPLRCGQATCRRARRCRGDPCTVSRAASADALATPPQGRGEFFAKVHYP